MSDLVPRRTATGGHEVVHIRREHERAGDQEIFKPVIERLTRAIDILGGEQEPAEALADALAQIEDGLRKLNRSEPGLLGTERNAAAKEVRRARQELQAAEKRLVADGEWQ